MDEPSLSETLKDEEVSPRPLFQIRSSFVECSNSFMSTWMMFVVYLHSADASLHSTALWLQLDLFSGNASCVRVVCWPDSCSCEPHVVAPHHFSSLWEFSVIKLWWHIYLFSVSSLGWVRAVRFFTLV